MIIVVLGMHRSGTSLVSSILHAMGIRMGEPEHMAMHDPVSQPHGYWEDRYFVALNRQIIKAAGGHWHNPPSRQRILRAARGYDREMSALIAERKLALRRINEAGLALEGREQFIGWGWKDPRNCLTMEAWWPHILDEDVRFVKVRRALDGIIDSLIRRGERLGGFDDERQWEAWVRLIREHQKRVQNFIIRAGVADVTTEVEYEHLVSRAEYLVPLTRLAGLLGLEGKAYTDGLQAAAQRIEFRG